MKCGKCTDPDYCACADFFASWRAYWSGAMDHLMTREQIAHRNSSRPLPQGPPRMTAQELMSPSWTLNEGDMPASWIGHCDDCYQPICDEGRMRRAFNWLCYRLLLAWPDRWMPWPLLPHAGSYAYSCGCKNRRLALRARASSDAGGRG